MPLYYLKKRFKYVTILLGIFIIGFYFVYKLNNYLYPLAYSYSRMVCDSYINQSVREVLAEKQIQVDYDANGYNIDEIQPTIISATQDIENLLGGNQIMLEAEIPIGVIVGIPILDNYGLNIPFQIQMLQSITSNLDSEVKEYGLNNALVQLNLNIEVSYQMYLPFSKEINTTSLTYPLSIKVFEKELINSNSLGM